MTVTPVTDLYAADLASVAAAQRLRFFPAAPVAGKGATLIEADGRELVDLSGAWGAAGVGYAHPTVVQAVTDAMMRMPGASLLSATNPDAVALSEDLLGLLPEIEDGRVYLGHAGSDANAAALRGVRAASDRKRILAFEGSYHGGLGPAQHVSGIHVSSGTAPAEGLVLVPYLDLERVAAEVAQGDVAAVIVEPILSDGGVVIPESGALRRLTDLCHGQGVLVVVDEVKVGLGRTGLLHAFRADSATPDVVTFGKGLGGGLPLSAAVGPVSVMDAAEGSSLLTTAGNPVCAAAGRAVLQVIADEALPERASQLGERLSARLTELAARHATVLAVRSRGLVGGIELLDATLTAKVAYRAWELGAVVYYVGPDSNVLELTPPLVIAEAELERGVDIIDAAIADVVAGRVDDALVAPYGGW